MSAITKSTHVFATHDIPLECDVYQADHYPKSSPVLLFFHSGGLVAGGRQDVPPWLVQTCVRNQWPLVSASYRLLPQVDGEGLLEDAKAAYDFAKKLGTNAEEPERRVIAAGSSAGFFLAANIARHLTPRPLALLANSGIPTFRHQFFNSSVLIVPEPILPEGEVERLLAEPVSVGTIPPFVFDIDMVLPSGAKNLHFDPKSQVSVDRNNQDPNRGMLYEYFVHRNAFLAYVGKVDPGFGWQADKTVSETNEKLRDWPFTIMLQGDKDEGVDKAVCVDVSAALGSRAVLLMVQGEGHLFGRASFLEDQGPGMDEIRLAAGILGETVDSILKST